MSEHISDDLPRLLTGEAGREETLAAAAHLRECPDCQQELVSAVVAHASLSSARRFAAQATAQAEPQTQASAVSLPDMSDVFTKVRHEAARSQTSRVRRRALIAIGAAAVIASGVGVTIAETTGSTSTSGTAVALSAYDEGSVAAIATLTGPGTMRVDASALPRLGTGRFYEVWLTNANRTELQPVGSLGDDNQAQLTVSPKVMGRYTAIEVSVQQLNQTSYSGHSVLRGAYR